MQSCDGGVGGRAFPVLDEARAFAIVGRPVANDGHIADFAELREDRPRIRFLVGLRQLPDEELRSSSPSQARKRWRGCGPAAAEGGHFELAHGF
jgi:hypothetical protein